MDIKGKYRDITLSAIQRVIEGKKDKGEFPSVAFKAEIRELVCTGVDALVEELVKEGEVTTYATLNSRAYEIKNEE